jgi:hypothetical protein
MRSKSFSQSLSRSPLRESGGGGPERAARGAPAGPAPGARCPPQRGRKPLARTAVTRIDWAGPVDLALGSPRPEGARRGPPERARPAGPPRYGSLQRALPPGAPPGPDPVCPLPPHPPSSMGLARPSAAGRGGRPGALPALDGAEEEGARRARSSRTRMDQDRAALRERDATTTRPRRDRDVAAVRGHGGVRSGVVLGLDEDADEVVVAGDHLCEAKEL